MEVDEREWRSRVRVESSELKAPEDSLLYGDIDGWTIKLMLPSSELADLSSKPVGDVPAASVDFPLIMLLKAPFVAYEL
ncbi:hypothetical protein RYX36_033168 [Vicia faba]